MELILSRVRAARRSLTLGDLLRRFVQGLFWTALAGAILAWVRRWTPALPGFLWPGLAAGLVVYSAGMAFRRRPSLRTAAIALDRVLGLEDRLSTALYVREDDTPAAQALRRNAEEAIRIAARAPLPFPPLPVKRLLIPVLLIPLALFLPLPRGSSRTSAQATPTRLEIVLPEPIRKEESERLKRRAFSLEKLARELGRPELQELADAMRKTSEELRKESLSRNEALAKLSTLEEKSRGQKEALAAKMPEGLLKRMKGPGGDPSKAGPLKNADLARKLSELSAASGLLKEKLDQGAASSQERAELDRKLKDLAAELGKEGGPGLPADLESRLGQLLGQNEGGSAQDLAQALGDLRDSLNDLQALSLLEAELGDLTDAKDEFADSEGTCLFCGKSLHGEKGGRCKGCGALAGAQPGQGSGGGTGVGEGGGPGKGPKGAAHDEDPTVPSRPKAALHPGDIIGAIQFKSLPERGQLHSAYSEAYRALAAEATQALEQEEIPAAYRLHVRDYFDSIRPDKNPK
ncbi:MAG TPA: hypothetical protein VMU54_18425 [Planctomycetota bacterium]|nr:hypothetical protein [Planctomycetota bacterium]